MLDQTLDVSREDDVEVGGSVGNPLLPFETRNLHLEIDGKSLINGINLRLTAANLTVIMGQNGAGKSLLLRLLHGLLTPTTGEIFFGGEPLDDHVRAQQAMVFQRPVLLRRSVGANLDFVLRLRGEASASRRDSLLDQVGLLDKEKQPARLLSGGEQQRLALARVLALEPKVLFLDEPTASLDPASTLMIEEIARSVQRQGAMVVFVTHDLGQARRLADDIIFLHRGRVEEQSPAEPFFENPKSDVAKAFLEGRIVV
jgi:tungstate transport system ATP-binding protein